MYLSSGNADRQPGREGGWVSAQGDRLDLRANWQTEIDQLIQRGWAVLEPNRFRLTPQGLRFADAAGQEFLR